MSLYQLKKKVKICTDKVEVITQILDYVDYVLGLKENTEAFHKGEKITLTDLWDPTDTTKYSVLFPKEFWDRMITNVRPTTFITGSYNRQKGKHEFYWMGLGGSAFNVAQFELKKEGVELMNESENKRVVWSLRKCEKYVPRRWNNSEGNQDNRRQSYNNRRRQQHLRQRDNERGKTVNDNKKQSNNEKNDQSLDDRPVKQDEKSVSTPEESKE